MQFPFYNITHVAVADPGGGGGARIGRGPLFFGRSQGGDGGGRPPKIWKAKKKENKVAYNYEAAAFQPFPK